LAAAAVLTAGWLVVPSQLRVLLVGLAFVVGGVVERYRTALEQPPPSLRATPHAWRVAVARAVGWPALAAATCAIAVAIAVLVIGRGDDNGSGPGTVRSVTRAAAPPELLVRNHKPDLAFTVRGASFAVHRERRAPWARQILSRPPGRGHTWVTLAVHARNRSRPHFNPIRLSYRLIDTHGTAYVGDFRGGTGPRELSTQGVLQRGQAALVQLGFRVPTRAHRFALVFEDSTVSDQQQRIELPTEPAKR
jgi:hypothetical protein